MALRGRLVEQCARGGVVLRTASAFREHQSQLELRFRRIRLRRLLEQGSRLGRIGRRGAAHRASRLVRPRALPALAARSNSLRASAGSLGTPAPVAEHDAEFDHGRRAAFVGRLAIGAQRFRHLPIGGVGAAELRKARGAIFPPPVCRI